MSNDVKLPTARPLADFLVEELATEVLIYDLRDQRAHCLSLTAGRVWQMCDGRLTVRQAADKLSSGDRRCSAAEVEAIVAALVESGLAEAATPRGPRVARPVNRARRRFLGKAAVVGGLVAASPIIYSIVAPSVAQAASACGEHLARCTGGGQGTCCPGGVCQSGFCQ